MRGLGGVFGKFRRYGCLRPARLVYMLGDDHFCRRDMSRLNEDTVGTSDYEIDRTIAVNRELLNKADATGRQLSAKGTNLRLELFESIPLSKHNSSQKSRLRLLEEDRRRPSSNTRRSAMTTHSSSSFVIH